jgi:hypothetical protein
MKKWLRRKLLNILHSGEEVLERPMPMKDANLHEEPTLNFKVFNAVGGKVVEFRKYDSRTDRASCTTYIITNDQDFGERISKIATLENLKS